MSKTATNCLHENTRIELVETDEDFSPYSQKALVCEGCSEVILVLEDEREPMDWESDDE